MVGTSAIRRRAPHPIFRVGRFGVPAIYVGGGTGLRSGTTFIHSVGSQLRPRRGNAAVWLRFTAVALATSCARVPHWPLRVPIVAGVP